MCGCLSLALGSLAPRFTLVLIALFTGRIGQAFEGHHGTSIVGWLFLPFTELFYVVMFWWNGSVSGFSWFFVALGFVIDISSYAGAAQARQRNQVRWQ
ncbi:MAG: hypothetical protein WCO64_00905 [Actinomycetes bacterium]